MSKKEKLSKPCQIFSAIFMKSTANLVLGFYRAMMESTKFTRIIWRKMEIFMYFAPKKITSTTVMT